MTIKFRIADYIFPNNGYNLAAAIRKAVRETEFDVMSNGQPKKDWLAANLEKVQAEQATEAGISVELLSTMYVELFGYPTNRSAGLLFDLNNDQIWRFWIIFHDTFVDVYGSVYQLNFESGGHELISCYEVFNNDKNFNNLALLISKMLGTIAVWE